LTAVWFVRRALPDCRHIDRQAHCPVSFFDLLTPNLVVKICSVRANLMGYWGLDLRSDVHNGVAGMARNHRAGGARLPIARRRPALNCLVVTMLLAAGAGMALAQTAQPAPPTAGPASPAVQPPQAQTTSPQPPATQTPTPQTPATQIQAAPAVTPSPEPPPSAALPSPAREKSGFFSDFARWWHDSVSDFNAKMKEQQSKLDDFNKKSAEAAKDAAAATQQAMKNAADAMVRLPTARIIEIHEPCAIAGNGAADCAAAASNACKGKGFADGQPLDVRTAEKCNASLWLQGQGPRSSSAECPVETVVLRAACQ
jgi:outer membrane biosynthesis protein TonB